MAAFNRLMTSIFDVVLIPFELMSYYGPLVVVSGLFGILALVLFKRISFQAAIKATKDKIKGHMIAIRIYQDDLVVVGQSVLKVLTRNMQYLGLNFGPILPLVIPFLILAAQFVVRYAYDPVPVQEVRADFMSGEGTMVEVEMSDGHAADVAHLSFQFSDGLRAMTEMVRAPSAGRAFQEVIATEPGTHEITLVLNVPGQPEIREIKTLVAGDEPLRTMQPRRVSAADWYKLHDTDHCTILWPGEEPFAADSPFNTVSIAYPFRELAWLPDGEMGILITVVVASMAFGAAVMKPLGVQI